MEKGEILYCIIQVVRLDALMIRISLKLCESMALRAKAEFQGGRSGNKRPNCWGHSFDFNGLSQSKDGSTGEPCHLPVDWSGSLQISRYQWESTIQTMAQRGGAL